MVSGHGMPQIAEVARAPLPQHGVEQRFEPEPIAQGRAELVVTNVGKLSVVAKKSRPATRIRSSPGKRPRTSRHRGARSTTREGGARCRARSQAAGPSLATCGGCDEAAPLPPLPRRDYERRLDAPSARRAVPLGRLCPRSLRMVANLTCLQRPQRTSPSFPLAQMPPQRTVFLTRDHLTAEPETESSRCPTGDGRGFWRSVEMPRAFRGQGSNADGTAE